MAKKKSLKERIDALVNAFGAAEKPSSAQIRNELVALALDVEKLEDGQALAQKDARISDLEAALEKSDVELGNLKLLLEEAGGELEAFRTAQEERQEKEREIDPVQFQILQRLHSESECKWLRIDEIARALKIPVDEAEVYVEGLDKRGLVVFHYHEPGGGGWHRTAEGNKWVVAKRWAGEEEQPNANNDLGENAQKVLILIAREDGLDETAIAERMGIRLSVIRRILRILREKDLATDKEEPGEAFTSSEGPVGPTWRLLIKGEDYLAERSSL